MPKSTLTTPTLDREAKRRLAADGNARIDVVSSTGHQQSPVVWDDIDFAFRPYDPWPAYGQSKTANVLFAIETTRRRAPTTSPPTP